MSKITSSTTQGGGFGCFGLASLLLVAFIVLKLTNYIDWSWWWVISPMIVYAVLLVGVVVLWIVLTVLGEVIK